MAELSGRHVVLPQSRLPIVAEPDVLVVGGGSAGVAAATAVARNSAEVMLVERFGYLEGLASGGLIILLLTMDDGAGRQAGVGVRKIDVSRLQERLRQQGAILE